VIAFHRKFALYLSRLMHVSINLVITMHFYLVESMVVVTDLLPP